MSWTNTVRVGRYTCYMHYSPDHGMRCTWDPMPERNGLTDDEVAQYKAGRTALLGEVAKAMGGKIVVVDI